MSLLLWYRTCGRDNLFGNMSMTKIKTVIIALLFIGLFGCVLFYAGLWGFEKYMETTLTLEQIDAKVNGPRSAFVYQEERAQNSSKSIQERLDYLTERQNRMEQFLLRPTDERGRRILSTEGVRYYLQSRMVEGDWSWQTTWNDDPSPFHGTSTLWIQTPYELRIPYNPDWGNAAYGVMPYEFDGQVIVFGPVHTSEMMGSYRAARFWTESPQTIDNVLIDPKNYRLPCGITEEAVPPKVLKIGNHQVVEVVTDNCELGMITYILPGKAQNYIFTTNGDEEILKWVIERFEVG